MKFLLGLLLLVSMPVHAEEAFASFGVGVFHSAERSLGETKVGNFGFRQELYQGVYWQFKGGYWGDGSGDPSRNGSAFVSTGPGMTVDLRPVEMRAGYGLAAISSPDSYLGGRFPQFQGEIYLGVRDPRGNGIGLEYDHISSAGLVSPNMGRDFVVLQLSQKW